MSKKKTTKKKTKAKPKAKAKVENKPQATDEPTVQKSRMGRPDHYKPEYCEMIIEHMSKGHSLTSFCATIGTWKQIAHGWMKKYPDFYDAYKIAKALAQDHWEKMMHATAAGKLKGNIGGQIFWMKNRFRDDWQDNYTVKPDDRQTDFNLNYNLDECKHLPKQKKKKKR